MVEERLESSRVHRKSDRLDSGVAMSKTSQPFLLWPAIVFVILAVIRLYYVIFPCQSGLFIGGCHSGKWVLSVLLFESFAVYALLCLLVYVIAKQLHKSVSKSVILLLGVLSLTVVLGSVFLFIPGAFDVFVRPMFYSIDFFSKVKLNNPFIFYERYTVLQRLVRLFLFPFLPDVDI